MKNFLKNSVVNTTQNKVNTQMTNWEIYLGWKIYLPSIYTELLQINKKEEMGKRWEHMWISSFSLVRSMWFKMTLKCHSHLLNWQIAKRFITHQGKTGSIKSNSLHKGEFHNIYQSYKCFYTLCLSDSSSMNCHSHILAQRYDVCIWLFKCVIGCKNNRLKTT